MHRDWAPASDGESVSSPLPDPSMDVPESSTGDPSWLSSGDSGFQDPTAAAAQDVLIAARGKLAEAEKRLENAEGEA